MHCPVCKTVNLVMSERQGIEIDYCPDCRGVWLDRGELDKLIERSAGVAPTVRSESHAPAYAEQPRQNPRPQDSSYHGSHHGSHQGGHYRKKKEGFLSELFDFD